MITRQGLEEEERSNRDSSGETGRNGGEWEVRTCDDTRQQLDRRKPNGKDTAELSSSEDKGTLIEIEGEHVTDREETDRQLLDGKEIRPGTHMLATRIIIL